MSIPLRQLPWQRLTCAAIVACVCPPGFTTTPTELPAAPPAHSAALVAAAGQTITVTGQRPLMPAPMPATTESLGADQIDLTINSPTTAGLLQYLPSVHVRERYIGDRNGVLVMRVNSSIASAQTTVYADGLLLSNFLNNSFSTAPRWGLVSPEEIRHVEVLYGPFSALYPGNSAGGVVRMVTREPRRFEAHARFDLFTQRFEEYGTRASFGGRHASASLGHALGPWTVWLALDHLASHGQPQTFGNTTPKPGAPAAAGSFTDVSGSRVYRDIDTSGRPRIIVSATGIDNTEQDMVKFKLGYQFTPQLSARYTLGLWRNLSNGRVDSYLRDAAGNTVYNAGSTLANPYKFVRLDGVDYTVSAAVPSRSESEHLLHGLALATRTGAWQWELDASVYQQKDDTTRTATPTSGLDSGLGPVAPAGTLAVADGTGWNNQDLRGQWRIDDSHTLSLGLHRDHYRLDNKNHTIANWQSAEAGSGTLSTSSLGQTRTLAAYLQHEWRFAPDWSAIVGGRQERWRAFGGSNFNRANTGANAQLLAYADRAYSHFSPKFQLAWQARPDLDLRAAFGRGVRYPTVSEMFQNFVGPNNIRTNDPNLRPEKVDSAELVVHPKWDGGSLRASYFHERKTDALISQTDVTVTPNITSIQNVDRVRTNGLELALQATPQALPQLELQGSVTRVHSIIVRNSRNPGLQGTLQPRIPDWRLTATGTWHASERLGWSLSYRYSGRQHNALFNTATGQYNDVNPNVYGAVSHYSVFDAKMNWKVDANWTLALGVNNLGSFKYYVNPNPYPQRTFFATLKCDL